ncbi:MAG: dehypoxanthine futalosine cyclase [Nitrospira bacterium HGW-Nitrospira-1]|nr:MAG: dehypoxanthine futalosine cyclase [Nitrospira bacterium HGW-Nitrospira-1]
MKEIKQKKNTAKKRVRICSQTPDRITKKEALTILKSADILDLGLRADNIRKQLHPEGIVSFVVDRNINYTNVCINKCTFCAFWRDEADPDAYVLDRDTLFEKIEETLDLGGTQILIQGGLHPHLDIDWYVGLLQSIKERFKINIHGFSPPEICYIADSTGLTIRETLQILREAGLDSVPGGGAEILSDRVREILSPRKIQSSRWIDVMETAHRLGMRTTATMMFGSIEQPEDIITHLDAIRELQDRTGGFTAFIPWSFQAGNTELATKSKAQRAKGENVQSSKFKVQSSATAVEYLKVLALSRIYLDNINNIQASWVTQGLKLAQVALRFGANDFGSTMIEENVVASTGVSFKTSKREIINAIRAAGFIPAQRDTCYNILKKYEEGI